MESKLKLDLNAEQNLMNSVIQCIQKNIFMNETLIKKINKKFEDINNSGIQKEKKVTYQLATGQLQATHRP